MCRRLGRRGLPQDPLHETPRRGALLVRRRFHPLATRVRRCAHFALDVMDTDGAVLRRECRSLEDPEELTYVSWPGVGLKKANRGSAQRLPAHPPQEVSRQEGDVLGPGPERRQVQCDPMRPIPEVLPPPPPLNQVCNGLLHAQDKSEPDRIFEAATHPANQVVLQRAK